MNTIPDKAGKTRLKVTTTERSLLVAPEQSKKLADLCKRSRSALSAEPPLIDIQPDAVAELSKARAIIEQRIGQIMAGFPDGRKSRLFAIRYGSVEAVKAMPVKAAFKTLDIADSLVKMQCLAEMDCLGRPVKS